MGVGKGERLYFDHGFLGDSGIRGILQWLHHAYLEVFRHPLKNGAPTDCCMQQFLKGVLDIIRIKRQNSIQMDLKFEGSQQRINCST